MYRIAKRYRFAASHQLLGLPEDHKCHRLHGHNYEVEFVLASRICDRNNMVLDYGDIDALANEVVKQQLDHQHLNDVLGEDMVTAEFLAEWFYNAAQDYGLPYLYAVRVFETANTWAEYTP